MGSTGRSVKEHERRLGPGGDPPRQVECFLGARTERAWGHRPPSCDWSSSPATSSASRGRLHASVPYSTGVARFGVEARTVDVRDVADDRGAPNVDGEAPRVAKDWFRQSTTRL